MKKITIMKKGNTILLFTLVFFFLSLIAWDRNEKFKIIKEQGIPVAVNPDHPIPAENGPRDIIFEEELTIGEIQGDSNYAFGEFIDYTVDEKGNMYVLDWRAKTVRKFDRNGKYVLSFGREGQGPGEFTFPKEIRFLANGHLMVFEGETQKFSRFKQDGEFIKSGKFKKLMYSPYLGFSNGNFIATNILRDDEKTLILTGLFNEKSEPLASLYQSEMKPVQPWPSRDDHEARARRMAEAMSKAAFRKKSVIVLNAHEDIYFAFTDTYEIMVYSADVKLKKRIRTNLLTLPVEKKDRQDFLNIWVPKDISNWGSLDKQFQNRIKNLIRFPKNKPAFLEIIPMDNDFVMVIRDGQFNQNSLIDIFDPQGRFIIEKRLSFNIRNGICKGGKLYTIYENEDRYQFVKRYNYKYIEEKRHSFPNN